jgi:phosphoribosylglycinamide formyltransferase 1
MCNLNSNKTIMPNARIAILASGSGSNAENIHRYFQQRNGVDIALIVANKSEAYVHVRAKEMGVPSLTLNKESLQEGGTLLNLMHSYKIDFIVLAGYLLRVPADLIEAYPMRIVNIHPALLPKHGGKGMYGHKVHEAVLMEGDDVSGITIHYVNEQYDEGQIIFQATCPVEKGDTPDTLATKVHALEYEHFPKVVEACLQKSGLL